MLVPYAAATIWAAAALVVAMAMILMVMAVINVPVFFR
jgi:hypothetical protein